jgi:predicted component of type VI protein secretion system
MDALPTAAPPPPRQAALLARLLAESMIANVQTTAALNRSAADALLAQARLATPIRFDQLDDAWRASWRSFELSARTADRVLGLTRDHVERSTLGLARITERLLAELAQLHTSQVESLREAFTTLREAQEAYLDATQQAHQRVIALAQPQSTGVIDA